MPSLSNSFGLNCIENETEQPAPVSKYNDNRSTHMKTNTNSPAATIEPTEDDVRDYAYHLYLQSGGILDRDLDNWLEAKACLCACVPKSESQVRLHHHTRKQDAPKTPAFRTKGLAA